MSFTEIWKKYKMDKITVKWWIDRAGELEKERDHWKSVAEEALGNLETVSGSVRLNEARLD